MQELFGAIDIGSNTTLLLIVAREGETFEILCDEIHFTRLAEGMADKAEFSPAALDRLEKAFQSIKKRLESFKISNAGARAVATSAARRAGNQNRLTELAEKCGVPSVEIISPEREAELTFIGSLFGLGREFQNPLVVDIGGGSTELVSAEKSCSLNMGSVSLTERFFSAEPLGRIEKLGILGHINSCLEPLRGFLAGPYDGAIFTAGTPVTLAFMEKETDDTNKIHGSDFSSERLDFWFEKLASLSLEERKKIPFLPQYRADVIVSGAAVLKQILSLLNRKSFTVSATGVRCGLVLERFH